MSLVVLAIFAFSLIRVASQDQDCLPVYVRWPRVRLNLTSRLNGGYTLEECAKACSKDEHPGRPGFPLQCSGFNHKHGASSLTNDCQLFQKDQVSNLDGNVEYDDRYSFYWKYCVKAKESCKSVYHYDFHIDRYMDYNESQRRVLTYQVEDCLEQCLNEKSFECRSVSFNRTAGYCYLSGENRLSKPTAVRVNGNPNYRIDFYENKCNNDCFTFHHVCRSGGVLVSVDAKFPYTGAMYGLYDFFSCRIEPKDETKFEYFFPFSSISKNCSDSMSIRDGEYVLEVVLSTDNVIPLYFLTDEDLIYKVKCPVETTSVYSASTIGAQVELIPPLSKIESVSSILPDASSTNSTSASAQFPLKNAENETTTSIRTTTEKLGKSTESSSENLKKKPLEILPSLDSDPSNLNSVPEERRGNKITLLVRYQESLNESIKTESNSSDEKNTPSSSAVYHINATISNAQVNASTWHTVTALDFINSTASSISDRTSTGELFDTSSRIATTSFSTSTSTPPSISSSTKRKEESGNSIEDTKSSSSEMESSTKKDIDTSTISTTASSTTGSSISTKSSTSEPLKSTTASSEEDDDEEEPRILPFIFTSTSTPEPSTTSIPSWLYAWRLHLASSKHPNPYPKSYSRISSPTNSYPSTISPLKSTTSSTSLSSSTAQLKVEPALNIDVYESISSFTKPADIDSRSITSSSIGSTTSSGSTTTTGPSTSSSTYQSSSTSSSTSTMSTSTPTTVSSTDSTSTFTSPFWPFLLRNRQSTSEQSTTSTATSSSSSSSSISSSTTSSSTSSSSTTSSTSSTSSTPSTTSSSSSSSSTTAVTVTPETTSTSQASTSTQNWTISDSNQSISNGITTTFSTSFTTTTSGPPKKILFDVFHNGQPVSAVVVGSRIMLSFLPSLSLPGSYMTLVGCQVEPVNSPYAWERDPLQIVKNGCQADGVGLVCPPLYTEAGVKVEMEAFRYTTTGEVLYSCLIRICPYGPCPQPTCTEVDGCNGQRRSPVAITSPAFLNPAIGFGKRRKRQQPIIPLSFLPISTDLQQNLISLAGDHVVNKKLVVVNSETELQYYLRTGNAPTNANLNALLGR